MADPARPCPSWVVKQVDPRDDAAFTDWFAVLEAVQDEARPGEAGWLPHEIRALALDGLRPDPDDRFVLLSAQERHLDGALGPVAGAARLDLPQRDNLDTADLTLGTHPQHRRRGVARALVVEVERRALADGRTAVTAFADEPPGQQGRSVGRRAAQALGYEVCQVEVRRDIDLPLDPALVERVRASALPHASGYELCVWRDRVPDHLLADQAVLNVGFSTDAPVGGLQWGEEVWDGPRVRRDEQQSADMGRTWFGAGAVHRASGRMVAYTNMGVPVSRPERAHQWGTMVLSEHRGHRLGVLVKLACLERLSREMPATRVISTHNAEVNAPMIAVNHALGARVNGQETYFQKRLGPAPEPG